jgi:S1-C subfamily serine protease
MTALPRLVVLLALASAGLAHAQDAAQPSLTYGVVDRATVRVFAVRGVGSERVRSESGVDRLVAVPEAGHGSGLIISEDGLVLTAAHVIDDVRMLAVWVPGESRAYPASVVYSDPERDIAFLAVPGTFPQRIPLAAPSQQLRIRQTVHAIGYPLDARRMDPQSSRGIISGVLPSGELQLDMALNPGNSGGPLIDEDEHVVGIVVARGDPTMGVQNIGVAVPVGAIIQALENQVYATGALATARSAVPGEVGSDIAEVVTILARFGAADLIREVMDVVDHQRQGEILTRLRALGERSQDADVVALTAAYFWDTAAVVLERGGGAMRPSQLPAGPDRQIALDLLNRSIALCRRAAQLEPTLAARSPFVAHVLHYLAAVRVDPVPPVTSVPPPPARNSQARTSNVPQPQASDSERPPGASVGESARASQSEPDAPRGPDYRTYLGAMFSLPHQAAPGFGIGGVAVSFVVDASPYTLRLGPVAGDLLLGGRVHLGYWADGLLLAAGPEIGIGIRIGDHQAATFGITYAPAAVIGDGAIGFAAAGVRAYAGVYLDPVTIALGWEAIGRQDGYSLHLYQIAVTFGL